MKEKAGYIYILTNPSFPDYLKIGYTTNVEQRLKQLNKSECIPFAFRVFATYETHKPLQDKQLHALIDSLNPDLRAVETFNGKTRTKEFYAMTAEDGFELLKSIAEISGTQDRLKRRTPEGHEILDELVAQEISTETAERREPFSFKKCGIEVGEKISLKERPDVVATVVDDRKIEYKGEVTSLSRLAQDILNIDHPIQGPLFWLYQGKTLCDIRYAREKLGLYNSTSNIPSPRKR